MVRLWDTRTGLETLALTGNGDVCRVCFSPQGHFLATVSDREITLLDGSPGD